MQLKRMQAVVLARAHTAGAGILPRALGAALARYQPLGHDKRQWVEWIEAARLGLVAEDIIDERGVVKDRAQCSALIGESPRWAHYTDRVLPAAALGDELAAPRLHPKDRDGWVAAVLAAAEGQLAFGKAPTLGAVLDAMVFRDIGIMGKAERCPAGLRLWAIHKRLGAAVAPVDRAARQLAAKLVGASRADSRALKDGLVRRWLVGDAPVAIAVLATGPQSPNEGAGRTADFALAVQVAAAHAQRTASNAFGTKVYSVAVWRELTTQPAWRDLSLDEFKHRLVAAHERGSVQLARADLVSAMDPALLALSEMRRGHAVFHFVNPEVV